MKAELLAQHLVSSPYLFLGRGARRPAAGYAGVGGSPVCLSLGTADTVGQIILRVGLVHVLEGLWQCPGPPPARCCPHGYDSQNVYIYFPASWGGGEEQSTPVENCGVGVGRFRGRRSE